MRTLLLVTCVLLGCIVAGAFAGGAAVRRGRSIEAEVVALDNVTETIHTEADEPIVPRPFCNSLVANNGAHDYCYAVFSYESRNNFTLSLSHNESYYFGAPNVNQNPTSYYSGGRESELSAFWICDPHVNPVLGLKIVTPLVNTTSLASVALNNTVQYTAVISRTHTVKCPQELLEWFEAREVPDLFDA